MSDPALVRQRLRSQDDERGLTTLHAWSRLTQPGTLYYRPTLSVEQQQSA
jgi:hypothetical protein